ncbi:PhzF family phenazine biosynthesis protein [Kangiella sp. HD9-110m-PIT-SAG07]|nr:PhzF family phenazine biosynthesis protein [Kangiella sp. HD9-110m-PIT-SAG07]
MQSTTPKRFIVRVFATLELEGTTAVVYLCDKTLSSKDMQTIAHREAAPATCFINQQSTNQFHIRFYNTTKEIQLCGHGLLASAKVVGEVKGIASFKFQTQDTVIQARYSSQHKEVEIAFSELISVAVSPPAWVNSCFSITPNSVFQAGSNNGYWVMEWPQASVLQDLEVKTKALIEHTQRAVIATQQSDDEQYDYNFRYFAPQHGVIEDKATGSAHRVLMSYWHQRLNKCNFKARQYSKEGAELTGRIENGDVWISGNVDIQR